MPFANGIPRVMKQIFRLLFYTDQSFFLSFSLHSSTSRHHGRRFLTPRSASNTTEQHCNEDGFSCVPIMPRNAVSKYSGWLFYTDQSFFPLRASCFNLLSPSWYPDCGPHRNASNTTEQYCNDEGFSWVPIMPRIRRGKIEGGKKFCTVAWVICHAFLAYLPSGT